MYTFLNTFPIHYYHRCLPSAAMGRNFNILLVVVAIFFYFVLAERENAMNERTEHLSERIGRGVSTKKVKERKMVMKLCATKKELFCTKKKEKTRESEPNWFKKRLTRKYILCSFPTTIADCLHRTLFANRVRTRNKQTNNNNRLMSINFSFEKEKKFFAAKGRSGKGRRRRQ